VALGPRAPTAPAAALSARFTPKPTHLDPDRAQPVVELVVLRHVLERDVGLIPHAPDVVEPRTHVVQPLSRLIRGQPFLELPE